MSPYRIQEISREEDLSEMKIVILRALVADFQDLSVRLSKYNRGSNRLHWLPALYQKGMIYESSQEDESHPSELS